MVAAGAEACGPDIPHVQLGAWRQEQVISPGLGAPEPPGPQAPMFWGGKSRRLCSSVKMQGSGLRWACIPSKLKSYQEWGLKMVRTCPPHTQGDCGNNAAELGTGVSTHLGTKRTSHGGDSSLRWEIPWGLVSLNFTPSFTHWFVPLAGGTHSRNFCAPLSEPLSITARGSEVSAGIAFVRLLVVFANHTGAKSWGI